MYRTTNDPRALAVSIRGPLLLALALVLACPPATNGPARRRRRGSGPTPDPVPATETSAETASVELFEPLHFSTESPAIGTEVGIRSLGVGTTTSGKAGWLLFGPYVALPAGNYQAAVHGVTLPGHAGSIYVDVAAGKGTRIIVALDLDPAALAAARSPDGMIVLPFTLADPVEDLEFRIRVTEQSQMSVSTIDFLPVR